MIKQRRKHPRLRVTLAAEYRLAGERGWHSGTVRTLGAGGAAFECASPLVEGSAIERLRFTVAAEGERPEIRIDTAAEVVSLASCEGGGFVHGLRFDGLDEPVFDQVRQFVCLSLVSGETPAEPRAANAAVAEASEEGIGRAHV